MILHLIDAASPQACPTTLALLADALDAARAEGARADVLLLGGTQLTAAAEAAGLTDAPRLGVPYGQAVLGLPAVRRRLRDLAPPEHIERIEAWSVQSLALARWLRPSVPRRLWVTQPLGKTSLSWLRRLIAARFPQQLPRQPPAPTRVCTLSEPLQRQLLNAGLPANRVTPAPTDLALRRLRPAAGRAKMRERWGINSQQVRHQAAGPAGEPVKVIALLSDPPEAGDAQDAAMAVGLCRESLSAEGRGPEVALLVHPRQYRRLSAQQMIEALASPVRLIQEPRLAAPWQVLAGCDAALSFGPAAGGLSLRWALAAGCPVVVDPHVAARVQRQPADAVLVAESDQPQALGERLTRLLGAPTLAGKLAESTSAGRETRSALLRG